MAAFYIDQYFNILINWSKYYKLYAKQFNAIFDALILGFRGKKSYI